MIEVKGKMVRLEGNIKTLMNDWMNATRIMYKIAAKEIGLKAASTMIGGALQVAANDAADELKKEGELSDE